MLGYGRTLRDIYIRELRHELGYLPTWYPGTPRRIGDVGFLIDGEFQHVTSLEALGIPFKIDRRDAHPDRLFYETKRSVAIETTGAGEVPSSAFQSLGELDAGLRVSFKRANAVVLDAAGVRVESISELDRVADAVGALPEGIWKAEFVFVREVLAARACSILVSSSRNAHIELKATANVEPGHLRLSSASAKLVIKSAEDMTTKIITETGMTPLYHVAEISFEAHPVRHAELVMTHEG